MKDKFDNIEDLFKDGLDGFESDVDPGIWENVSSQISGGVNAPDASSASSSSGSSAGIMSGSIVKVAIVAGTAAFITVGAFLYMDDDAENISINEVEEVQVPNREDIISNEITKNNEDPAITIDQNINPVLEHSSISEEEINEEKPVQIEESVVVENKSNNQTTSPAAVLEVVPVIVNDEQERSDIGSSNEISPEENGVEEESTHIIFEPSIHASIQSGILPLEVRFENRGTQSDNISWQVNGGEVVYDELDFEYTYENSGQYWVVLRITDEHGHEFKDSTLISVEGKYLLSIPNVISPNGDGFNDELIIKTEYIKSMNCVVMDRNGSTIAFWVGVDSRWDGRDMSGKPVGPGTYFITVQATDMDGKKIAEKGTVTIF